MKLTAEEMVARNAMVVAAVRADALVGRGTCSTIDECYSDEDIVRDFAGETTIAGAVRAARKLEELRMDRMMDCRFGDDDDGEVSIMKEWRAAKKAAGRVKVEKEWRISKPVAPVDDYAEGEYCARSDEDRGYVRGR